MYQFRVAMLHDGMVSVGFDLFDDYHSAFNFAMGALDLDETQFVIQVNVPDDKGQAHWLICECIWITDDSHEIRTLLSTGRLLVGSGRSGYIDRVPGDPSTATYLASL